MTLTNKAKHFRVFDKRFNNDIEKLYPWRSLKFYIYFAKSAETWDIYCVPYLFFSYKNLIYMVHTRPILALYMYLHSSHHH